MWINSQDTEQKILTSSKGNNFVEKLTQIVCDGPCLIFINISAYTTFGRNTSINS